MGGNGFNDRTNPDGDFLMMTRSQIQRSNDLALVEEGDEGERRSLSVVAGFSGVESHGFDALICWPARPKEARFRGVRCRR